MSHGNGYTSEESDYSVATPSDEQMYQEVSFLPADTNELVEVVADFCTNDDLTALTPQQQQRFGGKVIKGKVRRLGWGGGGGSVFDISADTESMRALDVDERRLPSTAA
jgi:hypothetical protein